MDDEASVTLYREAVPASLLRVSARITSTGALIVEGQSLGGTGGSYEYEYARSVAASDVPTLSDAIARKLHAPNTDSSRPLQLVERLLGGRRDAFTAFSQLCESADIKTEFWSRLGD